MQDKVIRRFILSQVDILHPLASLEWRQCRGPPAVQRNDDAHVVCLKDKVYVGGGLAPGTSRRDRARLYIYNPVTDTWTTLDTPVYHFVLTTYHSQLVLVGGYEYVGEIVDGSPTSKLWTLSEDGQWQETLPPMPTPCGIDTSAVSHGDHLLVISDDSTNNFNKVYVYNGHHWASAQCPPQWLCSIKSAIFNGYWYLMGEELSLSYRTSVYSASLDSLLASCQPSETSQPSSVWKKLPDAPSGHCYLVVFGNRLVSVGYYGWAPLIPTSLYVYSSFTQSWVHMEDVPGSIGSISCAVVLPSNELMIVKGETAFMATLKSKSTLHPQI